MISIYLFYFAINLLFTEKFESISEQDKFLFLLRHKFPVLSDTDIYFLIYVKNSFPSMISNNKLK